MTRAAIGWIWVGVQAVLIVALVAVPGTRGWPTPTWLEVVAIGLILGGVALAAAAGIRLGPALTPTPVPNRQGQLATEGLYRHMRHPIYTGVLADVVDLVLRSGSWLHTVIGLVTIAFFDRKAA